MVWNGPVRVAMAFQCFRITCSEGLFQMPSFQTRITVFSESSRSFDTI